MFQSVDISPATHTHSIINLGIYVSEQKQKPLYDVLKAEAH